MYLLDTNHCSRLLAGDAAITARLTALGDTAVSTCVIVRGELIFMAEHSSQRAENLRRVAALLVSLPSYPVDDAAADWYGALKAALLARFGPKERAKRRRTTIATLGVTENDLWIAAITKRHNAIIVSSDSDFVRIAAITDLAIESWVAPPAAPV